MAAAEADPSTEGQLLMLLTAQAPDARAGIVFAAADEIASGARLPYWVEHDG